MKKFTEPNKISNYLEYGIDNDNLEIFLFGDIDHDASNKFITGLNLLSINSKDKNKYKPIIVHLNSCGGEVSEGMAIYDAIKALPNPIIIVAYGQAMSMGSIIFQAGTRRIMMPHTSFMIHAGSGEMEGTPKQVESYIREWNLSLEVMFEIYSSQMKKAGKFSKMSKAKIKEKLKAMMDQKEDVYLTAKQTVDYGLADEVFTSWRSIRK